MLTRLRVKGFKNLEDIEIRFGPFTCFAGPNGAGKSNIFDAIQFLNLLATNPIFEAVSKLRESPSKSFDPRALFTSLGEYRATEMSFECDLLIDRKVIDDFGVEGEAAVSMLRYKIVLRLDASEKVEKLVLAEESLQRIKQSDARRALGFPMKKEFWDSCISGRRTASFISTEGGDERSIHIHQDGRAGQLRKLPANRASRTVVGGQASSEYPTILAAQREFASWKTMLLEPSAMRMPSQYRDIGRITSRGGEMAATVHRLDSGYGQSGARICAQLANRLSLLLEDVRAVRVNDDPRTQTYTLEVAGSDGAFHPARSLSDGTLRFLVLAIIAVDPDAKGILCLEEPENGIHPERIPAIVSLLKSIAVDSNFAISADNPLRQVVINTHSPDLFKQLDPLADLVYIDHELVMNGKRSGRVAAARVPQGSWRSKLVGQEQLLSRGFLQSYFYSSYDSDFWQEKMGIPPNQ